MSPLRYCYHTIEFGKTDIHLRTLRNNQEFYDPDDIAKNLGISSASWPLFGVIWPSSMVLAHHMHEFDSESKSILEVGCGMGLASLLLNKQNRDITATDYHPEVQGFLADNAALNGDTEIAFERVDWSEGSQSLGHYDVIIGSDLLYEDEHIDLLANFINAHANDACEVIIVDPGRGRKNKISKRMAEFGFSIEQIKPENTQYLEKDFKGHILIFRRNL